MLLQKYGGQQNFVKLNVAVQKRIYLKVGFKTLVSKCFTHIFQIKATCYCNIVENKMLLHTIC